MKVSSTSPPPRRAGGEAIEEILSGLAASLPMQAIRPASLWAMRMGLHAALTDGLGGEIRITIPPNPNHPVEASFSTARP
jgi:hypothetical protein